MQDPTPTARPNFLLFITDQQRADHVGAYGNAIVRTPCIDALAAGGFLAQRCYVASPICMPNRASLMTGRMPSVHGARHNGIPLPLDARTFVERLREEGWGTALVGKSHLQNITAFPAMYPPAASRLAREARHTPPGRYDQETGPRWEQEPGTDIDLPFYGFESVDLAINHGDTAGGHYRRWLEHEHPDVAAVTGPAHAVPTPSWELPRFGQAWRTRVPESLSTTSWVADRACDRLGEFAAAGRPFFIQCSFPDPHHPFTPPGRFWDMYRPEDMPLPASFHMRHSGPAPHLAWMHAERDQGKAVKHSPAMFAATEREVRESLALNYGSIAHIDEAVGRVLAHLDTLGIADNTVVIFTSDHGDYFGDHQLLWKGPLHYQGVTRVPLIWRDPAATPGVRSAQLCSTIDIAPTVLARAGCSGYNGIQGRSLLPVLQGGAARERDALLIEEEGQRVMFGFPGRTRMRSVQTQRHRLSIYAGAEWGELYDLQDDPHETANLWEDARHAGLRHELLHRLATLMIEHADESPNPSALA